MRAAESLFSDRRFHEVTLDEVAQAAQVGKGTIYRFFPNKDDLFFETATSGFDDLCEILNKKAEESSCFYEKLVSACGEIMDFFDRRRPLFRMMQMEEGRVLWSQGSLWGRWQARRGKMVKALSGILEHGGQEGTVRTDVPYEVMAHQLLGMLRTQARYLSEGAEPRSRMEMLLDLYLHGIGRPKATAAVKTRVEHE